MNDVQGFYDWIVGESKAFRNVMREYGQLRMRQGEETATFSVVDGNFKLEVKSNKVKSFDERADLAAERLIDYLKNYIAHSEKGVDDPMYQMAMTLLERNRQGDLDYKSISLSLIHILIAVGIITTVSLVDGIEVSASNVQAAFVIACFTIVTILEREFRSEKDEE